MDVLQALTFFGFTQLESLVYHELLQHSPATGYRLAHQIGKAPANVYQALKALSQKGAIVGIDDVEGTSSYMPVPPQQLFASIRSTFEENHQSALAALERVYSPAEDETVYQLRTVNQVLERSRAMLAKAQEIVVYDMMPPLCDILRDDIAGTKARGVKVVGIAYRPGDAGSTVPYNGEAETEVAGRWPGAGLILITDGREQLIAQISRDMGRVLNAIYSDSVFLSSVLHSAVLSDIRLVALTTDPIDPLKDLSIKKLPPPGLRAMNASIGTVEPSAPAGKEDRTG